MESDSLSHEAAVEYFVDAVVAFSDDPGPANLERYLRASRSLEESRRSVEDHRRPVVRSSRAGRVAQRTA
jgi:hypothetical protein